MESIMEVLRAWNKSTPERVKVQHVYIAVIVVVTVVSGLISLISPQLGRQCIMVASVALIAFIANALVWALTRVYLLDRLERKRPIKK